jgi:indolepyruvate ferredoxin oxidoreductase
LRGLYRAVKLNGADVANNIAAFDLGRVAAAEPERLDSLKPAPVIPVAERPIEEIIARRIAHLTGYQNAAYAARYADLVARVQAAESALGLKGLAKAVALNAAKVMAYKDEYEVARLYTDGSFRKALAGAFAGDMKMKVWLAPPLFAPKDKATGVPKKIAFGGWIFPAFGVLAKLKGLREGPFDVFGRTGERRAERALRDRYLAGVERLIDGLTAANHALAIEIATLPDGIRGFGHVKEAAMKTAAAREAELWSRWEAAPTAHAA